MDASDHAAPKRPYSGVSVSTYLSPRGQLGYGALSFATALITLVVAVRAGQAFGPSAGLLWAILLTAALVWHLISARRVAATRLWALHAAPYFSVAAFWGLNLLYGAYPTGTSLPTPEPSALVKALAVFTLCGVFSWPAASLALAIAPPPQPVMILPASLRDRDVVAVNEYPANTGLHTGHVNQTFYRRGADEGTYGYNAQGWDVRGRVHPFGVGPGGMKGGVFAEPNAHAQVHYVIVSDRNYNAMLAVARSQALSTAVKGDLGYSIALNNCADFIFRVFAASDLSPAKRTSVAIRATRASRWRFMRKA